MDAIIGHNPHLDQFALEKSADLFDDDGSGNTDSILDIPSNENMVLLPGDCIWYYNPGFVFGMKVAFRETIILSINPDDVDGFSLQLQNAENIPDCTKIRRVYQMPYTCDKGNFVMDHVNAYSSGDEDSVPQGPCVWQPVTNFVLNRVSQPDTLKSILQTEFQRVRKALDKNRKFLRTRLRQTEWDI